MYTDPNNKDEVIEDLKKCQTVGDVFVLIANTFPDWVYQFFNVYSSDYPSLQKNWEIISDKLNVPPSQIVTVNEILFDDEHTITRLFSEVLTRAGYSVRRREEFFACGKCNAAIPSNDLYNKLKEKNMPVPSEWSQECSDC